jgi:hypothetical protein
VAKSKINNFKGKANSNGFKGNPKNINKLGRPRKSFASINHSLKEKGVTPLRKSDLLEAYELIFNATENELIEIRNDKDVPYALKMIIQELGVASTRAKALQDYRNYVFGDNRNRDVADDREIQDAVEVDNVQIVFKPRPLLDGSKK